MSVLLNSVVTWVGWRLWTDGHFTVTTSLGSRSIVDGVVMMIVLDLAMYLSHRLAHSRVLYPLVHLLHHRYLEPRPLSLFALHPIEALGFGGGWIAFAWVASAIGYPLSGAGIALFTACNLVFGTLGHGGVEPLADRVRSGRVFTVLATPSFHHGHHRDPSRNLGFFTTIWDRAFATIDPEYDHDRRSPFESRMTADLRR